MLHDPPGLPLRLANAAIVYAKYLAMTIWPADLAVYYPYDFHPSPWQAVGAALLLLAVTGGAVWYIRRTPYLAVGWLWYLGTLVPVIGLVQVGSQAMADRYCYIPSIGIFLAFVWAVGDLARWLPWSRRNMPDRASRDRPARSLAAHCRRARTSRSAIGPTVSGSSAMPWPSPATTPWPARTWAIRSCTRQILRAWRRRYGNMPRPRPSSARCWRWTPSIVTGLRRK